MRSKAWKLLTNQIGGALLGILIWLAVTSIVAGAISIALVNINHNNRAKAQVQTQQIN